MNDSKRNNLSLVQKNMTDLTRISNKIETTNKLLEKIDTVENRKWWNGLDQKWKELFLMNLKLNETENYDFMEVSDFTILWESYSIKSDYEDYVKEDLDYNISDSDLEKIMGMKNLNICQSEISDISPISKLLSLVILNFADNNISDITPISRLSDLKVLNCMDNPINFFKPLSNLKKLTHIFTKNAPLDLSELLSSSDKIEKLYSSNRISNFDLISNFSQMKELYCGMGGVKDLSPIVNCTNLTYLDCYDNLIEDLTPLRCLKNLKSLHLNYNIIEDLSPISTLENLEELWCDSNLISSIKRIFNLKKLRRLWASFNYIPKSEAYDYQKMNPECDFGWQNRKDLQSEQRVLIVDDNRSQSLILSQQINKIITDHLAFKKCIIDTASNVDEGLNKLNVKGFGIIFINLKADKLDGLDLVKEIRDWLIPKIIYGEEIDEKIIVNCIKSGATEYLNLPLNYNDFKAIIKKCVYYY